MNGSFHGSGGFGAPNVTSMTAFSFRERRYRSNAARRLRVELKLAVFEAATRYGSAYIGAVLSALLPR